MDGNRDYDAIVVGAGPGGLTAAAYLGKAGRRVLVIDARDELGGHMSAFTHAGYEFDIGLHHTSTDPVQQVLRPLGVDVAFRDFDPTAMFRVFWPDRELGVPRGMDAFRSRLYEAFPSERETADTFLSTVEQLTEELDQLPDRPHLRELPSLPWRLRGLLRYAPSTAGAYLDTLHASPQLKHALLSWTTMSVGVQPSRLSLPVAARLIRHYLDGVSYPQGGSRAITQGLADTVRAHGGDVLPGSEVTRILVEHGRVRGVRVRSASLEVAEQPAYDIHAPAVVSAVDVKQTYLQLLPPDCAPSRVTRRVRSYELVPPLAGVCLVLDRDLAAEGHPNATGLVCDDYDLDAMYMAVRGGELPANPAVGVWVANLADPGNPRLCPPGQTNLQVTSFAPASHAWWGIAPGSGPTPRYAARKRQVRDQLVRSAERAIPGLGSSIVHEETATPISDERFMRCTDGSSYGPAFTPRQTFSRLGPAGMIGGLFHAGAGVRPSHGLLGTLHGGVAAAAAVTAIPAAELQASAGTAATAAGR